MAVRQERPARPRALRAVTVAAALVTIAGIESAGSPCGASEKADRDMARLGGCLAPGRGRLLSRQTGGQLLALMRSVEPSNAFGIQAAEPAGRGVRLAVKNGWTEHGGTGLWNVNCLAMWGAELRWALAVALRYPIERGLRFGADVCRRVTAALFP